MEITWTMALQNRCYTFIQRTWLIYSGC